MTRSDPQPSGAKEKGKGTPAGGSGMSKPNMLFGEFIVMAALLMALPALSTDAILPALDLIGTELGQNSPQDLQLVITVMFAGLSIGQIFYGPLSDQLGRKRTMVFGIVLFFIGNLVSAFAESFSILLLGRLLQGLGVAGPRIVLIALVRDLYAGRDMARIMSFVMGIFIFVPAIAPILGQSMALVSGWRSVFIATMLLGLIGCVWLLVRQDETLPPERRVPVSPKSLAHGLGIIFSTPSCFGYMVAAGVIMGPFILYISTAQNLLQTTYGLGESFPFYFAGLALSIGVASFLNSRLVMKLGMRFLARSALTGLICLSCLALALSYPMHFVPDLWMFLVLFSPLFFCLGLLFGNMNALAMEEVGQVAGFASAAIGAVSTFLGMGIATVMGQLYDGTILALGSSFAVAGTVTLMITYATEYLRRRKDQSKGIA